MRCTMCPCFGLPLCPNWDQTKLSASGNNEKQRETTGDKEDEATKAVRVGFCSFNVLALLVAAGPSGFERWLQVIHVSVFPKRRR
jgi:hypothetical protein